MPGTLDAGEAPPSARPAAAVEPPAVWDDEAWAGDADEAPDAARPLLATAATGVVLAAAALAVAGVVTLLAAFVRVAASGHEELTFGAAARLPLSAGFGLVAAGCLLVASTRRQGLRPATIALAALLPAAAAASGHPAWVLAATTAVGLAIAHDRRRPGRTVSPIPTGPALAIAAVACLTAGLALAKTADLRRPAAPAATPHATASPAATPAPHRTPSPVTTPSAGATAHATSSPAAAHSPAALVTAYYAALDARRFAAAWAVLAPGVRTSFGGLGHWRAGYSATVSSTPRRIVVATEPGGSAAVRHVLVARDRAACGTRVRRYAVAWRLAARPGGGWSVTSLTARSLPRGGGCS